MTFDVELGHIGHPLLVGSICLELSVQNIGHLYIALSPPGAVLLGPNQRFEPQLLHQPLNALVVNLLTHIAQLICDAPVAVAPLVAIVNVTNTGLEPSVLVTSLLCLGLVVEGAA